MKPSCLSLSLRLPFAVPKALLLLCLMLSFTTVFGQDTITRTDSVGIGANVRKIEPGRNQFVAYANNDDLHYSVNTPDVSAIEYNDVAGHVYIRPTAKREKNSATDIAGEWKSNQLTFNLIHLFIENVSVSYERITPSGKFGIKVPVSVNLNPNDTRGGFMDIKTFGWPLRRHIVWSGGLGLNIYPLGQRRLSYYFGPQADLVFFRFDSYDYNRRIGTYTGQYVSVALSNGLLYQVSKSMVVALDIGAGARPWVRMKSPGHFTSPSKVNQFYIPVGLHAGYRF